VERVSAGSSKMAAEGIREGLRRIAEALGIPLSEVVQLYASFTPSRARILEIVEDERGIRGIKMVVAGRRGRYVVAVGYRGWRCSCEAGRRGKLCRHAKLAVITWEILNMIKHGKDVEIEWGKRG